MTTEEITAAPASEFEGDWDNVDRDHGLYDGLLDCDDWEYIEAEDLGSADADERFTKILARHGEILISVWPGGDAGMGSNVKLFKLP